MSRIFRQTVRGMRDLMPEEAERLRFLEQTSRELAELYGYKEVITPVVEHYELLTAKIGEEIRERMYIFEDLSGRKVALRPEFTASIARLVATKMMQNPKPIRLFSTGSLYRYDEPQFGRYREFWQANYELIGSGNPEADGEILSLTDNLLRKTGLRNYHFKIGHVGILRGILNQEGITEEKQNSIMQLLDKKEWNEALKLVEDAGGSERCLSTLRGLFEIRGKDPTRIIEEIKDAIKDYHEALDAAENLSEILGLLRETCPGVEMVLEAGFARGLEYYTGIIFEFYVPEMSIALGGGGRYDRLIEIFGGEPTPAVGVAMGIDRMTLAMEKQQTALPIVHERKILVIPVEGKLIGEAFKISSQLREEGISAEVETMRRSVSRALSDASKRGITHVVIVGPREIEERKVVLRDMKKREQEVVSIKDIIQKIR